MKRKRGKELTDGVLLAFEPSYMNRFIEPGALWHWAFFFPA
jgi:hypothetical protein